MNFERISDDGLVARLKTFIGCERRLVAKVVIYLVEVERRRIHLADACTSMHDFCTRKLGMSEGETHRRLVAARLWSRTSRSSSSRLRRGDCFSRTSSSFGP